MTTKQKSYRELTAPLLVDWFLLLHPKAFINKARDAHLLRKFMDDSGALPTQVLEGMFWEEECPSIPALIRSADQWLMPDVLAQEAELAILISKDDPPPFYYDYHDLLDTGMESAREELAWAEARRQLEKYVDDALTSTASIGDRSRVTSRYRIKHGAITFTG